MPEALDHGALRWLYGLAVARLRRNERALAYFEPREGQDLAEAEAVRAKFEQNVAWQRTVIARLESLLSDR